MANIKQVAALSELSVSCVSKYLKNPDSVLPLSREKIEFAIKELNYVPSAIARNLRSQRTGIIKIISHNITNPFFAGLFEMIRSELEKSGYIATLQSIEYMENMTFSPRYFEQCDGAIFCFIENEKTLHSIRENIPKEFPVVNIHGSKILPGITTIVADVNRGAFDATTHLIKKGGNNISYIGASENSTISRLKFIGFQDAILKNFSSVNYSLARNYDFTMKSGYAATKELFKNNAAIDSIFCENDLFAVGAIHYLIDQNQRVPEDIRIMGYDDIPLASMFIPSITSVTIPSGKICKSACTELISQINKNKGEDHYYLPELIERMST